MISRQEQPHPTQQREQAANGPGVPNGTLYLARRELRRTWRSYAWALGIAPLMGVAAAFLLAAASRQDAGSDFPLSSTVLNSVFILLIAVLPHASAWHSGSSGSTGWAVSSNEHFVFLRSLPLTVGQITAARALVSVISVMVLCVAFFTPLYSLSGPLREELGAAGCLLFAAFWVGCALAFEAVGLFTELGSSGIVGFWVYMVAICFVAGVVAGMAGQGESAVNGVVRLTGDSGALPALLSLAVGCGGITLSWLATARRLRKREAER